MESVKILLSEDKKLSIKNCVFDEATVEEVIKIATQQGIERVPKYILLENCKNIKPYFHILFQNILKNAISVSIINCEMDLDDLNGIFYYAEQGCFDELVFKKNNLIGKESEVSKILGNWLDCEGGEIVNTVDLSENGLCADKCKKTYKNCLNFTI